MSEEKFFQQVKGQLENYSPEVPESVYAGVRRKYARSRFFSWSASRLNVWYVALLLTGAASIFCMTNTKTEVAAQKAVQANDAIMNAPMAPSCASASPSAPTQASVAVAANTAKNVIKNTVKPSPTLTAALPSIEASLPNGPADVVEEVTPAGSGQVENTEEIVKEQEQKERKKLRVPVLKSKDK